MNSVSTIPAPVAAEISGVGSFFGSCQIAANNFAAELQTAMEGSVGFATALKNFDGQQEDLKNDELLNYPVQGMQSPFQFFMRQNEEESEVMLQLKAILGDEAGAEAFKRIVDLLEKGTLSVQKDMETLEPEDFEYLAKSLLERLELAIKQITKLSSDGEKSEASLVEIPLLNEDKKLNIGETEREAFLNILTDLLKTGIITPQVFEQALQNPEESDLPILLNELKEEVKKFLAILESIPEKATETPKNAEWEIPEAKNFAENKTEPKYEAKYEAKYEPKQDIKPEMKQEIKLDENQEIKAEMKSEAKQEIRPEIMPYIKAEAKSEPKSETELEPKQEIKTEAKSEIKSEIRPEARPEIRPDIKTETKAEVKTEARQDNKPEFKFEIKPDIRSEIKSEIKPDVKPEISHVKAEPEVRAVWEGGELKIETINPKTGEKLQSIPTTGSMVRMQERINEFEVVRQVVAQAKFITTPTGEQKMNIQLHPEHLGQLNLRISLNNGEMQIHARVESPTAQAALENHISLLREGLEKQGINLERLEISIEQRENKERQKNEEKNEKRKGRHGVHLAFAVANNENSDTGRRLGYNTMEYLA